MCRLSRNLGASTSWNPQGVEASTGIALPIHYGYMLQPTFEWRRGFITHVSRPTKVVCGNKHYWEMYTVSYELLETTKTVYIYQDSIGKSEEEIDIPAVAGRR